MWGSPFGGAIPTSILGSKICSAFMLWYSWKPGGCIIWPLRMTRRAVDNTSSIGSQASHSSTEAPTPDIALEVSPFLAGMPTFSRQFNLNMDLAKWAWSFFRDGWPRRATRAPSHSLSFAQRRRNNPFPSRWCVYTSKLVFWVDTSLLRASSRALGPFSVGRGARNLHAMAMLQSTRGNDAGRDAAGDWAVARVVQKRRDRRVWRGVHACGAWEARRARRRLLAAAHTARASNTVLGSGRGMRRFFSQCKPQGARSPFPPPNR